MVNKAQLVQKAILAHKEKREIKVTKVRKVNPDQLEFKEFKVSKESKVKLAQWVLEVLLVQPGQEV